MTHYLNEYGIRCSTNNVLFLKTIISNTYIQGKPQNGECFYTVSLSKISYIKIRKKKFPSQASKFSYIKHIFHMRYFIQPPPSRKPQSFVCPLLASVRHHTHTTFTKKDALNSNFINFCFHIIKIWITFLSVYVLFFYISF